MDSLTFDVDILPGWAWRMLKLATVTFRAPFEAGTLLHWPFLLSSAVIIAALYLLHTSRQPHGMVNKTTMAAYFSRAVWWHPSARADYLYYLVNGALFPIFFAPFFGASALVASGVTEILGVGGGDQPGWLAIALYSIAFFVAYDFGRYFGHWLQHVNPVLWEFHKIHHSAEVLTPLTSFRIHPIDLLFMSLGPGIMTGLVTGVAQSMAGDQIGFYTVLGMHGGIAALTLISNLRHTHVWLSYGPTWSRVFISPAQHQIHHSVEQKHFHKNIGWAFAIWDTMFGTLYVPEGDEEITYGLGDGTEPDYHGVGRMYVLPFVRVFGLKGTPSN